MVTVSESSSFESIKIKKIFESHGVKVCVSYVMKVFNLGLSVQGGNYNTILEVNLINQMKAEILIKNYYQRVITVLEKCLIDEKQL
jgi:hypothetical protein